MDSRISSAPHGDTTARLKVPTMSQADLDFGRRNHRDRVRDDRTPMMDPSNEVLHYERCDKCTHYHIPKGLMYSH